MVRGGVCIKEEACEGKDEGYGEEGFRRKGFKCLKSHPLIPVSERGGYAERGLEAAGGGGKTVRRKNSKGRRKFTPFREG